MLGEWTGTTEFHSNSGLSLWCRSFLYPLSGASIISKQLSLQSVPRPNHNRPITGQLCVWIWAALFSRSICQYCSLSLSLSRSLFLCLSLSFSYSLSFCFSLLLISFFLPVQPIGFNMHSLAAPKYPTPGRSLLSFNIQALCHCYSYILLKSSHRSKPSIS